MIIIMIMIMHDDQNETHYPHSAQQVASKKYMPIHTDMAGHTKFFITHAVMDHWVKGQGSQFQLTIHCLICLVVDGGHTGHQAGGKECPGRVKTATESGAVSGMAFTAG